MGILAAIPAAISAAGLGGTVSAVGAGLGAASAITGGIASRNQALYQAQVAKNNAEVEKRNSDQSLISGQSAETAKRIQTTRLIAAQTAGQAANGLDVAVGSPLDVRNADQMEGDLDALTIRYNATRQAYGFNVQADNDLTSAKMYKRAGNDALFKGFLGAGTSLISGASSITGQASALKAVGLGKTPLGNPELNGLTAELGGL